MLYRTLFGLVIVLILLGIGQIGAQDRFASETQADHSTTTDARELRETADQLRKTLSQAAAGSDEQREFAQFLLQQSAVFHDSTSRDERH